jgi:hypothetical protein
VIDVRGAAGIRVPSRDGTLHFNMVKSCKVTLHLHYDTKIM